MSNSPLPPDQLRPEDSGSPPPHISDSDSDHWGPAIARIAFLLLTVALLIGVFVLVRNFLHAIILGILGATMLSPVYQRILRVVHLISRRYRRQRLQHRRRKKPPAGWLRNPRSYTRRWRRAQARIASLITVIGVFCVIAIPIGFFSVTVIKQGRRTLVSSLRWIQSGEMESKLRATSQKYDLQNKWEKLVELTQLPWQNAEEKKAEIATEDISVEPADSTETDAETAATVATAAEPTDNAASTETKDTALENTALQAPANDLHEQQSAVLVADANDASIPGQTPDAAAPYSLPNGSYENGSETSPPPDLGRAVVAVSQKVMTSILDNILAIVTRTWVLVLNFFIMLFVMFYMFQDSTALICYLRRISPLGDAEQTLVINRIRDVARAVLVGILGTALVQSIVAMILFKIVGIPALFWGSLLGICSLIPFVGTTLVWIPAVGYLFLTGHPGQAIFLAIGCGGIVANIDNILRPLFISGGRTGMSYLVLFFSILGGLQAFGLVGVIYGPLISGLCALCLLIFSTQFKSGTKSTSTMSS